MTTPADNNDPRFPDGRHPPTINADLAAERARCSFSPLRLTHFIDGSASATATRRRLESWISRDPTGIFSNDDNNYLHRTERHTRALAKHVRLVELCRAAGIASTQEGLAEGELVRTPEFATLVNSCSDDPFPTSLHWVMFVPNIVSLCDDAQQAEWLPLCRDWKMIGCYAQTELGHGSNIRALETTATFLPESKGGDKGGSWIVNSPTETSAKFWPGTLGRTANHAMVIARLIDGEGVDRGIHNYLVPLRSMEDHTLLPGVETGDIGPKIGYNNMDNGFASFKNVKIPRRNMAMRFSVVDEEGNYTKLGKSDAASKVAYITMMQVRAYIIVGSNEALAMACTISIRYSALRRQGYSENGLSEVQVLDYRQQHHRLLPLLATSYGFFFTGRRVQQRLKNIERRLISGEGTITKAAVGDIHATTSALKSFTTFLTADGIEDCRKACGGHGFLAASGLPELSNTFLQGCTVEGDNHMLPQQVVKILLKLVAAVQSGEEKAMADYVETDMGYLLGPLRAILGGGDEDASVAPCSAESVDDLLDADVLLSAFRRRSAHILVDVASNIQSAVASGKGAQEAWNDALVRMARSSRAHASYLVLRNFYDGVRDESSSSDSSSGILGSEELAALNDCLLLVGLRWIEADFGEFIEVGWLSVERIALVRLAVLRALDRIRPNAVGLCDARDFSDFRLKSALGRYDGDVYPAIMKAARKDPLNEGEPGPGYEEHLKRLIVGGLGEYRGVAGTASRL